MKKTLILAFAMIGLSSSIAVASSNSNLISSQNPIKEVGDGVILELTDKGGKIQEEGTGIVRDFFHPGAQVQYVIGDAVSYRIITFPNGKPPVVIDIKKPN